MRQRRPSFANRFDPLAAWLFSDDALLTTDRSGNGYNLTQSGSFTKHATYASGFAAIMFGTSYLYSSASGLNLLGAMTAEAVCALLGASLTPLAGWGATGETEETNYTWQPQAGTNGIRWGAHEYGAGVNIDPSWVGNVPSRMWLHLVWTRSAEGDFAYYVNGVHVGGQEALEMPTGGSSGRFELGGPVNSSVAWLGLYFSVYEAALDADQALYLAKLRGLAA